MGEDTKNKKVALPLPGGDILCLEEKPDGSLKPQSTGHLENLEHGKPINGDVIELKRRWGTPLYDLKTVIKNPTLEATRSSGPPQVTEAYREGWDRIFGSNSNISGKDELVN